MKRKRKPTVSQSKLIQKKGLKAEDWMVERDTPTEMVIIHRYSDRTRRIIPKGGAEE